MFGIEHKNTIVQDIAVDLNGLHRMPITAIHITSSIEQKNLIKKTWVYLALDAMIIVFIVFFLIEGPIEKDYISSTKI